MAKSNGDLVAQASSLARSVGREPATIAETREWLDIKRIATLAIKNMFKKNTVLQYFYLEIKE